MNRPISLMRCEDSIERQSWESNATAITCPRCGSEFDATLFQFGQRVRCHCGVEIEYPGTDQRSGHVLAPGEAKAVAIAATRAPQGS